MAYKGNPSTDNTDAVRLLIGDRSTSTGNEIFTDGEIDYFISAEPNTNMAAAAAVRSLIGSTRGNSLAGVMSKQVGDLKIDYRTVSVTDLLDSKAKDLRRQGVRRVKPYIGGISQSDKDDTESDDDRVAPAFSIGQHDHPGLGVNSSSTF
jgi:hypothetical protein